MRGFTCGKAIKSKSISSYEIEDARLGLITATSDHGFPGAKIYNLELLSGGIDFLFLESPQGDVLSLPAYETLYNAISTEEEFYELKRELESSAFNIWYILKRLKK